MPRMSKLAASFAMAAVVIVGLSSAAWTQDVDVGKAEFQSSCAPCHGIDAKGKGPLAAALKMPPAAFALLHATATV